jgi:hypothetical protein
MGKCLFPLEGGIFLTLFRHVVIGVLCQVGKAFRHQYVTMSVNLAELLWQAAVDMLLLYAKQADARLNVKSIQVQF